MEVVGRKQARSKSFLTRKASKKQDDTHTLQNGYPARNASLDMQEKDPETARPFFNPFAISIIPDPLNELPAWYHREAESPTASAAQSRVKYPLHNPSGPRWYRNHHLRPPTVDGRPPSVFSPSFPPMASAPERGQDPSGMAGPSRTPSESPLPTPTSSQIRIQEPLNPRQRKISQDTYHGVELSDGADTWSPNGNHQQPPYGQPESSISPSAASQNHFSHRPRRASMTHGPRHRTMAPSPLSQSTSAVHLHSIDPAQIQLPRRLSKRRKPFTGLFATPGANDESTQRNNLRRQSTMAPSMTSLPSLQPSTQKAKRGSVLGRLVKRFSVLRKTDKSVSQNGYGDDWRHVNSLETSRRQSPVSLQTSGPRQRTSSRLSKSSEPLKRIPPPSIEAVQGDSVSPEPEGRRSSESPSVLEMSTPGRLMVANPDDPSSSGDNTPTGAAAPLPVPDMSVMASPAPPPAFKEDLPLPDIPRSESPLYMTPRQSRYADQPVEAPLPPSSPPLPDLPPPTPARILQALTEVTEPGSPAPSTVVPPSSPLVHARERLSYAATSPASTVTPLPPSSPEEIALARASMYVNPPTPYATPAALVIPPTVAEAQEPRRSSSKRVDRSPTKSKDPSRSKSIRETETFKLIRSPSGTMKQTEVIMGMGEQWEVVGTPSEPPKKTSKSKDKEKEKERTKEKPKPSDHTVHREESRRRRDHSTSTEDGESRHKRHSSINGREKAPSANSVRSAQTPINPRRSVRKSSEPGDSRSAKAASVNVQPPVQEQLRERHLSTTTSGPRPTSELHSAADWSSVRAKDAWEMERLWKARSMAYGPDGMPVVSAPATIGSDSRPSTFISTELQRVSSIPSVTAVAEMQRASVAPASQSFGSSHTYMVVQAPYQGSQGHGHPPYNPYASPPPQNHAMSPAQQFYKHPTYASPPLSHNPLPSPPRLSTYQPSPLPMSLSNPLPDGLRLSSYQPVPLPASLSNSDGSPGR
ncbi:hypothetical protein LXA43DRAFT_548674 [Ganoderma leucocontextum]|nr:hypothetical protein LXA43DRAFT_548674 [Ganoderma leucocontextum]